MREPVIDLSLGEANTYHDLVGHVRDSSDLDVDVLSIFMVFINVIVGFTLASTQKERSHVMRVRQFPPVH